MNFTPLEKRTVENQLPLEASKWLKIQVLIDADEMRHLLVSLGNFSIFLTSGVSPEGKETLSHEEFLKVYSHYVEQLQSEQVPDETSFRREFSSVFTLTPEALYALPVGTNQNLIRVSKPCVQLQNHRMHYSREEGKFHTMVFGLDSIYWGIQFSYPQLYRNPESKQVEKVADSSLFPNTLLFRKLQQWVRQNTIPTPFLIQGEQVNVPIRLGKKCLSWVNCHPQLQQKGLQVKIEGATHER